MIGSHSRFSVLGATVLALASAAIAGAADSPAYFQIVNGVGTGPPYPMEAVSLNIYSGAPGGIEEGKLLNAATASPVGWSSPFSLVATSPAFDFETVHYDLVHNGGSIPTGGLLDVTYRMEVQDPPGVWPGGPPFVLVTGSNSDFNSFFEVTFASCNMGGHKAGGGGTGVGRVGGKMVAHPGPGVELLDFSVAEGVLDTFFDITYRVSVYDPLLLDLSGDGVMRTTLTADILEVPEPLSAALATLAVVGVLAGCRRRFE